jgi:hypothetical protein
MAVKYSKWSSKIPIFSIPRDFWYENEPSGNPGLEQGCQIFLGPNIYQSGIFGMKINHLATLGRRRGKSTYCKNAFGGAPSS